MVGLAPSVSGGVETIASGLPALLAILADPQAAKDRLNALTAKASEAQKLLDEARAAKAQADVRHKEVCAAQSQLETTCKAHNDNSSDLAAREAKLAKAAKDVLDEQVALVAAK